MNVKDYIGMDENIYKAAELIMNGSKNTGIKKAQWYLAKYLELGGCE